MKIYTITYDLTKPTSKQVNIPNFTNCKLGVAIYKGDEKLDLEAGDVRLVESTGGSIPMLNKYADFMTAELSIGACNEDRKFKVTLDKGVAFKDTVTIRNPLPMRSGQWGSSSVLPVGLKLVAEDFGKYVNDDTLTFGISNSNTSIKYLLSKRLDDDKYVWSYSEGSEMYEAEEITIDRADYYKIWLRYYVAGSSTITFDFDIGENIKGSFDLLVNVDKSSVIEEYAADAPEYIVRKFEIEYEDGTLETMNVVTEP